MIDYEHIKEIAYPVAFFVYFVWQKLDALKAKRDRELVKEKLESQDRQREQIATDLKLATETTARELKEKLEEQNRLSEEAAAKIKFDLETANHKANLKLEEIHVDVNSKMLAAKKRIWELTMVLAASRPDDPVTASAAREAHKDYLDQLAAQERADERVRIFLANKAKQTG